MWRVEWQRMSHKSVSTWGSGKRGMTWSFGPSVIHQWVSNCLSKGAFSSSSQQTFQVETRALLKIASVPSATLGLHLSRLPMPRGNFALSSLERRIGQLQREIWKRLSTASSKNLCSSLWCVLETFGSTSKKASELREAPRCPGEQDLGWSVPKGSFVEPKRITT